MWLLEKDLLFNKIRQIRIGWSLRESDEFAIQSGDLGSKVDRNRPSDVMQRFQFLAQYDCNPVGNSVLDVERSAVSELYSDTRIPCAIGGVGPHSAAHRRRDRTIPISGAGIDGYVASSVGLCEPEVLVVIPHDSERFEILRARIVLTAVPVHTWCAWFSMSPFHFSLPPFARRISQLHSLSLEWPHKPLSMSMKVSESGWKEEWVESCRPNRENHSFNIRTIIVDS